MENTGVTTRVRDTIVEKASLMEIFYNIFKQPEEFQYIVGSQSEGTCLCYKNNKTDVDMVYTDNGMPVVTHISNCLYPVCILLLPDEQPGYFKLQLTVEGKPIAGYYPYPSDTYPSDTFYCSKPDKDQRLCLIQKPDVIPIPGYRQGPAHHYGYSSVPTDMVLALKGEDWPDCASEWLTRQRDNGWPSEDLIMKCKTLGFFMVYTCHPASNEKEFQWRISFSLQERLLVTQFNSVQLKCYMLLKKVKMKIIQAQIKEKTLTSYHCKTCMLYVLENTPSELWIPENLFTCLLMCLRQLLIYIRNNNCPNYFIPGENMFDRITSGQLKEKLGQVLERMLNSQVNLFNFLIQSSGNLINIIVLPKQDNQNQYFENIVAAYMCELTVKRRIIEGGCGLWINFLTEHYNRSVRDFQNDLTYTLRLAEEVATINGHTEEETDRAKSLILPFLRVHLLSCNLVCALSAGIEAVQEILISKEWEQQGLPAGYSKLKQAAAMLMFKNHERATDVLLSIPDSKKLPLCNCDPTAKSSPLLQELLIAVGYRPHISVTDLLNEFFQPCVTFLPLEQQITPHALQYEMVGDFGIPPPSSDDFYNLYGWRNWGVVDGNFLLHFLLHLNYQALGKNTKAIYHVKKMIHLLNNKTVSHRETCYNLLGWVHKKRGDITRAVECFRKSLDTASHHNSACWHLCFLICGY